MERSTQLTLAQILARLTELLSRKLSGTFFIATDTNTSCRFAIQDGKITHCTHKRDQGMAAIHSFMTINGGSCSFSEISGIGSNSKKILLNSLVPPSNSGNLSLKA